LHSFFEARLLQRIEISNREHSREFIQQQGFGTLLLLLEDWDEDILQDTETTSGLSSTSVQLS
jgi:hypothetical protein